MKRTLIVPTIIVIILIGLFFWKKPITASFDYAQELSEEGKYSESLEIIEKLLIENPENELLLIERGVMKSCLNDEKEALYTFNKVLDKNPANDTCRIRRVYSYNVLGDFEKAEADLKVLIESKRQGKDTPMWTDDSGKEYDFHVSTIEIAYQYGIVRAATGRFQEAYDDFSTCINHQFELADSYYRREEILIMLENTDDGCADVKKAIELNHPYGQDLSNRFCP